MTSKCDTCIFCSNTGGDVRMCLALVELLDNNIPCGGKLYRETDAHIPRDEDLAAAFEDLQK